jgi:hypothetical protein
VKNIIVMFKSVDKMVVDENVGGLIAQFKPLSLTRARQARMWDQSRHDMLDPSHRICTFCLHFSVNSVPKNDTAVEENEREMRNYTRAVEVWVKYSDAVDAAKKSGRDPPPYPKHPVTGQVMKMASKRPKLRQIIYMCMCRNSQCLMKGGDHGSSCFIKCMDASKDTRYTWDDLKQECTCPACACQCPGVYCAYDIQKIALGIAQMNRHKSLFKDNTESSKEAALQTFLRQNVRAGMCAVDRVAQDTPGDTNEEDRSILLQQTLMEGTASAMARNASTLPASSRQLLQQKFGTSTTVKLPNGQVIDTTALGANNMNLHTNNNHLGVA